MLPSASSVCHRRCSTRFMSRFLSQLALIRSVSTLSGRNPSDVCPRRASVRISSPAPANSTIARAICALTRVRSSRCRPPTCVRDAMASVPAISPRVAWSAGRSPKRSAVATVTESVKSTMRQSSWISSARGNLAAAWRNQAEPHSAIKSPRAAPGKAAQMASNSSPLATCVRRAPSEKRTAISRSRRLACASNRHATLAQAISRTSETAPNRIPKRAPHATHGLLLQRVQDRGPGGVRPGNLCSANSASETRAPRRPCTAAKSACAARTVTPSLIRPTAE